MRAKLPKSAAPEPDAERQLAAFIGKFEPPVAALIRQCRKQLRQQLPTAVELVYDNYNFFVIGYCAAPRASTCIVSIAAAANGVGLSFYYGASLKDPGHLLEGAGKQNRFVRIPEIGALRRPGVRALISQAVKQAKVPLAAAGRGATVIQAISAKQRPRRKG